jgi:hypothetical protein
VSRSSVLRASTVVLATLMASAVIAAAPASAQKLFSETFEDSFSFVDEDFCGVGMTVEGEGTIAGRVAVHLRQGLPYFRGVTWVEQTYTNPETGLSVTETVRTLERDLDVTVNGDGTYTVLVMATGNATVVDDSSGKAIARNPGQVRFEILISDSGTPDDFSDDEFLDFLGLVKGSTGRNDDFCDAVVPALS